MRWITFLFRELNTTMCQNRNLIMWEKRIICPLKGQGGFTRRDRDLEEEDLLIMEPTELRDSMEVVTTAHISIFFLIIIIIIKITIS